jgi:hypothetical protein
MRRHDRRARLWIEHAPETAAARSLPCLARAGPAETRLTTTSGPRTTLASQDRVEDCRGPPGRLLSRVR